MGGITIPSDSEVLGVLTPFFYVSDMLQSLEYAPVLKQHTM